MTTDPIGETTTETAQALLYRYGLPEDVIDGALCLHGQELAAVQRQAHDERRPHFHMGLPCSPGFGCHVGELINLIDPTRADLPAVSAATTQAAGPCEPGCAAPAAWIDGHPQLEAIAAAVWERCRHDASSSGVDDDPRNIAVAALAAVLAVLPPPADRAATRAEWDSLGREADRLRKDWVEMRARAERVEAEVKQLRADRAAVLREAADGFHRHAEEILHGVEGKAVFVAKALKGQAAVWREAAETLRRLAAETAGPCVCGEPSTPGSVHRTDGPCYIAETAGPEAPAAPEVVRPRRCPSIDIVYGRCIRPVHLDGGECFHKEQPIRIDEETDEDSLCGSEYPGDDNFVGQLCGLPKGHFGEHRCDEQLNAGYTAKLRWPAASAAVQTEEA